MKNILFVLCFFSFTFLNVNQVIAQENAAPSMHLNHWFPSNDAIFKMKMMKVVQSADASFFESQRYMLGYAGLQQTEATQYNTPHTSIFSYWNPNTDGGVLAEADHLYPGTFEHRFGGEGEGQRTIYGYGWELNTWYRSALRAWKENNRLYVANFIQNMTTGKWLHTATISAQEPENGRHLESYGDSFLENWYGIGDNRDGRHIRKAFFKENWIMNINGQWEKSNRANVQVNDSQADINRNGIYHNAFNGGYDATEEAYFMQHGGNTTASADFNGGRINEMPGEPNLGNTPVIPTTVLQCMSIYPTSNQVRIEWTISDFDAPQFRVKVEILDNANNIISTTQRTQPHSRSLVIDANLATGNYQARITIEDIFSQEVTHTRAFSVGNAVTYNLTTTSIGLNFDGINDYVEIPDNNATDFPTNQNFTVELWAKTPSTTQPNSDAIDNSIIERFLNGSYSYVVRYREDQQKIEAIRYDGANVSSVISTTSVNDDKWHHIAFVKDEGTLRLYIDGQIEATTPDNTTGTVTNNSSIYLGQRGSGTHFWKGSIDDLRFWNQARTAQQIQTNMAQELTGIEAGLVGYYPFNEGQASGDNTGLSAIIDRSPTANNGTLQNFARTTATSNWSLGVVNVNSIATTGGCSSEKICSDTDINIITNPTATALMRAGKNILTQGDVSTPVNSLVTFYAGESITLDAGFSTNGQFTAAILPCIDATTFVEFNSDEVVERTVITEDDFLAEELVNKLVSIAPNPAHQMTTITYEVKEKSVVEISIYDPHGRKVQDLGSIDNHLNGKQQQEFSVQQLTAGVYFIHLRLGDQIQVEKLVISK